ncbi:transcriptional regulator containing an amidase domain and an AraC-type DNA-binding HTH domain [Acidovorax sp. CF316]|uniref:helix-turn-helix domain-containing protein n=1 Tax=Acidovorax sp. CF316 TaxID=1144317 RepID=UPI00026BC2C5|nr:helix-turn-helix domain-containing protein [Acidovorax sp. CF316]EJE53521.1 transcriptional regulator containing an amidase domain and an AraC-type DNA-binding HTH domain [Acidovorax sp. CF316]
MPAATAPAPQPLRRWSTEVVAPAARLDYWVGAICEAFLEMDCSSREATTFDGVLQSLPVASLSVNQVRASTQDVYRTPAGIACSRQLPFYLIAQAESSWHVRQDGQVAHLRPGDVALVDSARPYELHFPEGVGCVSLQLPRAWVGQWLVQAEARGPRVAWRDQGWGQSLGALAVQLARDPASAQALPPALLSDHLGALLSAALEQPVVPAGAAQGLHAHLSALMAARIDQGGLSAQVLADETGISLRTLHRAFAARGSTFAGTLRQLRLARAGDLLRRPQLAHVSVAEIGRRCGFADASHFARAFQRAMGMSPAAWRRR